LPIITATGGAALLTYALEIKDASNSSASFAAKVGDPTNQLLTTVEITSGIISGTIYKCRYHIKNIHGWSVGYSPESSIQAAIVPSVPLTIKTVATALQSAI